MPELENDFVNGYGGIPGWMDDDICLFIDENGGIPVDIDPYEEEG